MSANTPSQWAALRTSEIGSRMGVRPLSSPAEFVVAEDDYFTAMRFSRSLDERRPTERSSQAVFVEDTDPVTAADWCLYVLAAIVIFACVAGVL